MITKVYIIEKNRWMRRYIIRCTGWVNFYAAVVFMLLALR